MPLVAGTKLGTYEIVAPLGAGGMGEVYRARDAKLNRDVAIKILPAALAADPAARARFEREAQAVAALSHPNILGIFDFGIDGATPYAVMELLDGGTLREHLHDGAVPARKTIEYAQQIAAGLGAAHAHGITHRDLKPENVFLTRDGRIKILDFGLAKTGPAAGGPNAPSMMATSPALTGAGTIVGTVGYMSPEQVRGRDVDHRSDIFAFGAILYELLSGQRAFTGESAVETMNAILKEDPPELTRTNAAIPPALDRIVRRCLEKNPDERFHSARDVAFALDAISTTRGDTVGESSVLTRPPPHRRNPIAVAAVVAMSALGVSLVTRAVLLRPDSGAPGVVRASITLPANALVSSGRFTGGNVAISPDGTRIVDAGTAGDGSQLYQRMLDSQDVVAISGPAGAQTPFFSPDGQWVAFFAGGKLKKVPVIGGGPVTLCDTEFGFGGV